ncbi:hypothetical protein P692DRAFT_20740030 [Suillus brevipes Sb2]|nr:hypothetical protein P692DRAFT_20740030 [Suillus brevipes Sb2]
MDPSEKWKKIQPIRILVIGRANAGILQRVCNTREIQKYTTAPGTMWCVFSIVANELTRSQRGEHDIKNVMGFRNNPGFVFRDSRGFQAGGESEFDKVKAFIARRSKSIKLKDQHHAIW